MFKNLLLLQLLIAVTNDVKSGIIFSGESKEITVPRQSEVEEHHDHFPWQKLPQDVKNHIANSLWGNIDKKTPEFMALSLINSIKEYSQISKIISKNFYNSIASSYNKFLNDNLNNHDFMELRFFIDDEIEKGRVNKDLMLLIKLLKNLKQFKDYSYDSGLDTRLMRACRKNYEEIVKLLIEAGAEVNAQHHWNGYTALMYAVSSHVSPSIIKLLLDNGADINIKDTWPGSGRTVLDIFEERITDDQEILKLLAARAKKD